MHRKNIFASTDKLRPNCRLPIYRLIICMLKKLVAFGHLSQSYIDKKCRKYTTSSAGLLLILQLRYDPSRFCMVKSDKSTVCLVALSAVHKTYFRERRQS